MDHLLGDYSISGVQRGLNVAFTRGQFVSDVVTKLFMDNGSAFGRIFYVDDRRQFFILDGNQINSITRDVLICRHNRSDWMPDKEGFVSSKHAIVRNFQIRKRARAWHRADFFRDVFARVNGNHARRLQSFNSINAIDARMRVQRAHKDDMQRIR